MKKLFVILILSLSVMLFLFPSDKAEAETLTLKVGFFNFSGYHVLDENGKRSGYGYDFLQRLARYADFKYEYVGYDESYGDSLEKLKNGELDILTSVSKTEEREKELLFSNKDIGTKSTIMTVRDDKTNVVQGDYSTYNGLKIAMLKENSINQKFYDFAADHGFDCEYLYYTTEEELANALDKGEADGIVSSSIRALNNEFVIESFDPSPFYICTDKDNAALMAKINAALDEMDLLEPDWRSDLKKKFYSTDLSGKIIVNAAERDYIDSLKKSDKKLKVLVNPDRAPYSYFERGKASGIFPTLFSEIARIASLPYEYIDVSDRAQYYELRNSGAADVVLDFSDDFYSAEEEGYKITDPYFSTTYTLLKRNRIKNSDIKKVAVISPSDNIYSDFLNGYLKDSDVEPVNFSSMTECVDAVKSGDCDATIIYSYSAELYMWDDTKNRLSSELIGEVSSDYTIGINSESNYCLLSLLNKSVESFSKGMLSSLVSEELSKFRVNMDTGLGYFLQHNPVYIIVIITVVLLILFIFAMLVVRTRNQRLLRKKVTLATAQLEAQKKDLSDALHAADAANRSKTTFLNNMSHDIRTPMNAIIGFTALATGHIDNKERTLDYLAKITQASNHLLSLINDVLDMSRIESGKVHIDERPENLADILQGLRNIIQSDIHAKRLELYIESVDIVNEEVYCDRLRLNQILLNLTSNAIKFTPSGGKVAIKVTQKPSKEGFGLYEFTVSDTGIGMSPEFVKTVFDPFTRERNSTVSGIQGTGLGMAITKNIVDIMGGTIDVKSEQGKGTKFTVCLELKLAGETMEFAPLGELKGLYSLVVDDDLVSCQSVAKMLRQIGMHAEWTVTGKEAIVRTSEAIELGHPFEVYIIDWSMPDMDGITTVKNIRSIVGDDSPIILMSAYDWADIESEARSAGVTDFISKPLFASDLHRTLERNLGKATPTEPTKPTERSFAGKRILLAEDNQLNREIAQELLEQAGLKVECAENGQLAYEAVLEHEPHYFDLVLMDIQMPIMNGYEASKKIRLIADHNKSEIPIIAMTANAFEEDKANAIAAGMNGHLAKPIDVDAMFKLLDNILKN